MEKTKGRRKTGRPNGTVQRRMRRETVKNIAKGMGTQDALVAAGYSPETARADGYRIIKHPEIQSKLTEAVARVLAKEQAEFDDIVEPYVKALKAKVVVKSSQLLQAAETEIPDHSVRMEAAAHLTKLYQSKNVEDEENAAGHEKPPVLLQVNFIEAGAAPQDAPVHVSSQPSIAAEGAPPPLPRVTFGNGKR